MKIGKLQRVFQIVSALAINSSFEFLRTGTVHGGPEKGTCLPVLHCHSCPTNRFTCPVGALQYFASKTGNEKRAIPWYLIGIFAITLVLVGRAPCGWLCPFGFFQDLLAKITKKKINIPKTLTYLRYAVLLGLVLIAPAIDGHHWYSRLCPSGTLFAGIPWLFLEPSLRETLGWLFITKMVVLVVVLVMSVFSSRFFCKVICPLGAILGLFNRWSMLTVRTKDSCTHCKACVKTCPVGISAEEAQTSPDCIRCMRCTWCKHVSMSFGKPIVSPKEKLVPVEELDDEQREASI